jgi:hypothetical protein
MSDIVSAMDDPEFFEPWFRGPTWDGWRAVLKGAFALPMSDDENAFFARSPSVTRPRGVSASSGLSPVAEPVRIPSRH